MSPVLFIKKANSSLQFYIDFRRLNNLTCKDRYPLPLIDETIARLAKAKIYTKLDIRQAFYRIQINFNLKEFITFYTCYSFISAKFYKKA